MQGRLCITVEATAATDGECSPGYASLRQRNGSDRAYAPRRREQPLLCFATANRWQQQSMQRDGEQDILCFASTKQRQRPSMVRAAQTMQGYNGAMVAATGMHRDGESRSDYASLRRSYGGATAETYHALATARAAQTMHATPAQRARVLQPQESESHTPSTTATRCTPCAQREARHAPQTIFEVT